MSRETARQGYCLYIRAPRSDIRAVNRWGDCLTWKNPGYFYTRLQNPTNDAVAAKICDLEGGAAAMLTSSGQAANFYAVMNIAQAGDHIVCASALYGRYIQSVCSYDPQDGG